MAMGGREGRASAGGSIGDPDERARRLNELLRGLVARPRLKHAILAVESLDEAFRWVGAEGEAGLDGTPMRADTPFFIASVDKLFIAAVVLRLHEARRLSIDEPVSAYPPRSLVGGLHRLGGVDYSDRITVRHLLAHTSGLPDYLEERPKGGRSLIERLVEEGDMACSVEEAIRIVRDRLTPHFPPQPVGAKRQKARYSDTNYQLLIAIIEAVTERSLHRIYEDLLFRPLDLRHTYVFGHSRPLAPAPEPATLWLDGGPLSLPLALRSLNSVYSTADDTLRFLRALVCGEIFEDAKTLALMQQRWNRFGLALDRAARRAPQWPIEYGLGMMRFRLPRMLTPLRPVPALVGHSGSTGSWLFHCPELGVLHSGTVDEVTAGAVPYRFLPKVLRVLERFGG